MAEEQVVITLIEVLIPIIITVAGLGGYWVLFRNRFSSFRNLVDGIDDAIKDGKVSKDELDTLWKLIQKMIEQNPDAAKGISNGK